jgi:hypothetical protein
MPNGCVVRLTRQSLAHGGSHVQPPVKLAFRFSVNAEMPSL